MKLLLTGSTGLIGSKVRISFLEKGVEVYSLVRSKENMRVGDIYWNPSQGRLDPKRIEGFDAVVHLAGENIASGRWTNEKKRKIRESRVKGTTLLAETLAKLQRKPSVFVSASAIGYYGDRGDEVVEEKSSPGEGFLPDVCTAWEMATGAASGAGIRVVNLRIGIVLTPDGGALSRMLPPFRMGLGGKIGSGRQFMSWVSLRDVIQMIDFCVENENLSGPVNAVAPEATRNQEFTKTLGKVLKRPTLAPLPSFAAKLALGEMADDLLLASIRIRPQSLLDAGFVFEDADLEQTLHELLKGRQLTDRKFVGECYLPIKRDEVFKFFCDPKNLEEITPPWLNFRIQEQSTPEIQEGTEFKYNLKIKGIPVSWKSRIENWDPKTKFADTQLSGPYAKWYHTHRFYDHGNGTIMTDEVDYRVPMGLLGDLFGGPFVRKDVEGIFKYREKVIKEKFLQGES